MIRDNPHPPSPRPLSGKARPRVRANVSRSRFLCGVVCQGGLILRLNIFRYVDQRLNGPVKSECCGSITLNHLFLSSRRSIIQMPARRMESQMTEIERTSAGFQMVIPGCERRTLPKSTTRADDTGQGLLHFYRSPSLHERLASRAEAPLRPSRGQKTPPRSGLFNR